MRAAAADVRLGVGADVDQLDPVHLLHPGELPAGEAAVAAAAPPRDRPSAKASRPIAERAVREIGARQRRCGLRSRPRGRHRRDPGLDPRVERLAVADEPDEQRRPPQRAPSRAHPSAPAARAPLRSSSSAS